MLSFFCCLLAVSAGAQLVIHGSVVDDSTGLPVINGSIYLNRTTVETTSNNIGEFTMEAPGIYSGELIVTAAGYECISYKLDISSTTHKFYKFKLIKKKYQKDIIVLPDIIRRKELEYFRHALLGITEEADGCVIENLASVYFVKTEDRNITYAFADTPLIIINKLLGYEIAYDLIEFGDDKIKGSYFSGSCRYREIGNKKQFTKRRQKNYYGSTMHFYRSLINGNLYEQGFSIFEIKKPKDSADFVRYISHTFINPDSIVAINPLNILFIDSISNEYYLKSSNVIIVQYNKTPESVNYLSQQGFVQGLNDKGFTAYISLVADKVGIDGRGAIDDPLFILYDGFWVYEKLANQLPLNYQPEQ
jgi:hypothetical protein